MNTKFLLSSDNNNRNELLKKKIIHYYIAKAMRPLPIWAVKWT